MSTQDLAATSRFMPADGQLAAAEVLGVVVRKRQQAAAAWWETVTDYVPAPWHPARAVELAVLKPARRGRSRAA
jgi:hypothetical protein